VVDGVGVVAGPASALDVVVPVVVAVLVVGVVVVVGVGVVVAVVLVAVEVVVGEVAVVLLAVEVVVGDVAVVLVVGVVRVVGVLRVVVRVIGAALPGRRRWVLGLPGPLDRFGLPWLVVLWLPVGDLPDAGAGV
jgi:hypothetical protein